MFEKAFVSILLMVAIEVFGQLITIDAIAIGTQTAETGNEKCKFLCNKVHETGKPILNETIEKCDCFYDDGTATNVDLKDAQMIERRMEPQENRRERLIYSSHTCSIFCGQFYKQGIYSKQMNCMCFNPNDPKECTFYNWYGIETKRPNREKAKSIRPDVSSAKRKFYSTGTCSDFCQPFDMHGIYFQTKCMCINLNDLNEYTFYDLYGNIILRNKPNKEKTIESD